MTNPEISVAITEAIEAHGAWRGRLQRAVSDGGAVRPFQTIHPDRPCVFGCWLETLPEHEGVSHRKVEAVRALHDHFHMTAATVTDAVKRGELERARNMLKGGGPYSVATDFLVRALHDWRRAL